MIVEYVRYRIPPERYQAFEQAYAQASAALDAADECLSYELAHGVEEPDRYILRIEWDSREAHEQGFRRGPAFQQFFAAVRPFFDQIEEMRHYELTAVASASPPPA